MSRQSRVRIDGAAVRTAGPDLEVEVRGTARRVTRVADVTDHLPGTTEDHVVIAF